MKTTGELRVRVDFNVTKDELVDEIKAKTAELINLVQLMKTYNPYQNEELRPHVNGEKIRLISLAQTAYEEAAMWAVKAATYKPEHE